MLITGEVGTGKTTLARYFLSKLGPDTHSAFVLYPALSAEELLKSVLDDLHVTPEGDSKKSLVDALHRFLLEARAAKRNVVLLIDEAQDLSPEVLEQVRLISNLETDTEKLIQIVLMGQSELRDLLRRHELRQLAQRVTARYHLSALTLAETRGLHPPPPAGRRRRRQGRLRPRRARRRPEALGRHPAPREPDLRPRAARRLRPQQPAHHRARWCARPRRRWRASARADLCAGTTASSQRRSRCCWRCWRSRSPPAARRRPTPRPTSGRLPRGRPHRPRRPLLPTARGSTRSCASCPATPRSRRRRPACSRSGAARRSCGRRCAPSSSSCARSTCRPRSSCRTRRGATPASRRSLRLDERAAIVAIGDEPRLEVPLAQLDGLWTQDAVVWWPEEQAAATEVAATRQALAGLGFSEPDLMAAVARFQQQTSLVADGRLGPRTRMALYALSPGERPRLSPGAADEPDPRRPAQARAREGSARARRAGGGLGTVGRALANAPAAAGGGRRAGAGARGARRLAAAPQPDAAGRGSSRRCGFTDTGGGQRRTDSRARDPVAHRAHAGKSKPRLRRRSASAILRSSNGPAPAPDRAAADESKPEVDAAGARSRLLPRPSPTSCGSARSAGATASPWPSSTTGWSSRATASTASASSASARPRSRSRSRDSARLLEVLVRLCVHLRGHTPETLVAAFPGLSLPVARRVVHRLIGQNRDELDGVPGLSKALARELQRARTASTGWRSSTGAGATSTRSSSTCSARATAASSSPCASRSSSRASASASPRRSAARSAAASARRDGSASCATSKPGRWSSRRCASGASRRSGPPPASCSRARASRSRTTTT